MEPNLQSRNERTNQLGRHGVEKLKVNPILLYKPDNTLNPYVYLHYMNLVTDRMPFVSHWQLIAIIKRLQHVLCHQKTYTNKHTLNFSISNICIQNSGLFYTVGEFFYTSVSS